VRTDRQVKEVFIAILLLVSPPFFICLGYFAVVGVVIWLTVYIPFLIWGELPLVIRILVFVLAYGLLSMLFM